MPLEIKKIPSFFSLLFKAQSNERHQPMSNFLLAFVRLDLSNTDTFFSFVNKLLDGFVGFSDLMVSLGF